MPQNYEHINRYEREIIAQMRKNGQGWNAIGDRLGRAGSSVWREYHRNQTASGEYFPCNADSMAEERLHIPRRSLKVDGWMAEKVKGELEKYWSPEQIVGRGRYDGYEMMVVMTIYNFLATKEGIPYRKYLRGPDKKRKRAKKIHKRIHDRVMIGERPKEAETREECGHLEGDTVRGPMSSGCCVMTLVDRKNLYLVTAKLADRKAENLNKAVVKQTQGLSLKTITVDNGMEFASHKKLEKMTGANVYFAHPGCPWERGVDENTNGLLRQFFPKGTDFENVSEDELARKTDLINNRPRKSLGYMTALEVLTLDLCKAKDKATR